ncbi:hypothetical protein FOA43_003272 [Brettanomyces nanus]|uniref:Uncharacterized protein n=1 Tax=Eeniella nana TaxID=13502 RepID=A0A875S3H9_EENNA|nr:uncharacterized protein FOA43_003272 [Brettanomyces nanus]QPG75886.1 hypothetical protein FOA43_003272 [Brettanomyces nanus]
MVTADWNLAFNSGGKLLSRGHVITPDGKFAIAIFKTHLRVYSLSTRQSIRSIKLNRDLSDVVDSKLSNANSCLLYLFTSSNEILAVNWRDKSLTNAIVKNYSVKTIESDGKNSFGQILKLVNFNDKEDEFLLIFGKPTTSLHSAHSRSLIKISIKEEVSSEELATVDNVLLFNKSTDGKSLVFVTNTSDVYYTSLVESENQVQVNLHQIPFAYKSTICSVAISNGEAPMAALGTVSGVIQLLYLTSHSEQRLLKWHVDQVKAVEFNSDGSYLISGGIEKVLVFWQLDTEKQQFLPRLNGCINQITIDDRIGQLYGITLELSDGNTSDEKYMEFLVLNALDLSSKLDVNGLRPHFSTNLDKTIQRDDRRMKKLDIQLDEESLTKIRHNFTTDFEIHPTTKSMYLPSGARIQVYDIVKNDQVFVTTMARTLQQGKVRSETSIQDPSIDHFAFTQDGNWMCTFDKLATPKLDHLMSENDVKYSLKFWKYIASSSTSLSDNPHWELCTKIIDPHGSSVPIASIISAPVTYCGGLAFVTADTKGGLRLWRPRIPKEIYAKLGNKKLEQTAWTLRKFRSGNGRLETTSIDISWSGDASVIVVGQENAITLVDVNNFEEIKETPLPSLADGRIRALKIVGYNLIMLTKERLISFNLLTYQINQLCVRVHSPIGGKSLLAVDDDRNLVCFCVNYYSHSDQTQESSSLTYPLRSRIFVFEPSKLKPVYIADHSSPISCVKYSKGHSGFVLLDIDAKVGILNAVTSKFLFEEEEKKQLDKAYEMNTLLSNAQIVAKVAKESANKSVSTIEDDEELFTRRTLNPDSLEPVLENMEGLSVEALFDRVMNLL